MMLKSDILPARRQSQTAPRDLTWHLRRRYEKFVFASGIPNAGAWLSSTVIASALLCSRRHVCNLITEGLFDCVIDIRAAASDRPTYRVLRASYIRFGQFARGEPAPCPALETDLAPSFAQLPEVLVAADLAAHLGCTVAHVHNLADEFARIGLAGAQRESIRIPQALLFDFIKKRKLNIPSYEKDSP